MRIILRRCGEIYSLDFASAEDDEVNHVTGLAVNIIGCNGMDEIIWRFDISVIQTKCIYDVLETMPEWGLRKDANVTTQAKNFVHCTCDGQVNVKVLQKVASDGDLSPAWGRTSSRNMIATEVRVATWKE